MQGLVATVGIFAGSMWDIVQNHGAWSRAIVGTFVQVFRAVGVM